MRPLKLISLELRKTRTNRWSIQTERDCAVEAGPIDQDLGFCQPRKNLLYVDGDNGCAPPPKSRRNGDAQQPAIAGPLRLRATVVQHF
jgi:hypothetical protein